MKKLLNRQDGLTLVEVLAEITILAIVFVGFFSIFPRMTAINTQTEVRLETMNLARVELEYLKQSTTNDILLNQPEVYQQIDRQPLSYIVFEKIDIEHGYRYIITHFEQPALGVSGELRSENDQLRELYRIHIEVRELEGDQVIGETFGYVPYEIVGTDLNE